MYGGKVKNFNINLKNFFDENIGLSSKSKKDLIKRFELNFLSHNPEKTFTHISLDRRKIINMYAIVEIAGHQYKVQKDQQIYVNRLQDAEGSKVTFDKVLLTDDGKNVTVGAPAVEGVKITASVVQHLKGDKVIVFKKKRRKGYQKKNGFRAYLTELKIENIG